MGVPVGEGDRAEFDSSLNLLRGAVRARCFRLRLDEFEDALRRGHGGLHRGVAFGDIAQGHKEAGHILEHGDEHTPLHLLFADLSRAIPEGQGQQQPAPHFHRREVG